MATDDDLRALEERLRTAERVCGLVGMNATDRRTERGRALTQAWMDWNGAYGGRAVTVTDDEVRRLSEIRERRIAETLAAIERDYPEILARRRAEESATT